MTYHKSWPHCLWTNSLCIPSNIIRPSKRSSASWSTTFYVQFCCALSHLSTNTQQNCVGIFPTFFVVVVVLIVFVNFYNNFIILLNVWYFSLHMFFFCFNSWLDNFLIYMLDWLKIFGNYFIEKYVWNFWLK